MPSVPLGLPRLSPCAAAAEVQRLLGGKGLTPTQQAAGLATASGQPAGGAQGKQPDAAPQHWMQVPVNAGYIVRTVSSLQFCNALAHCCLFVFGVGAMQMQRLLMDLRAFLLQTLQERLAAKSAKALKKTKAAPPTVSGKLKSKSTSGHNVHAVDRPHLSCPATSHACCCH